MNLKNKDIAEGMYVTNGKDVWKVLDWNSKYTDCLLQKIDKNGNKMDLFVVAEKYELYGDEKEPQITWMNGDYCIEKRRIDAEQYFIDFYKDNKIFKESKKSLKERSEENEIIISELTDTVEYFCGLYEEVGELKENALKDLQNAIERLEVFNAIGSIYQWGVEVLNKCGIKYKGLKESKKSLRKSLKESAKPINEKNVSKFVDELNKWCDDNVHYKDVDSAKFTKQYGKLYDFKYKVDHSFGDADIIVWDDQGTLDLFEDDFITEKIDELAKKYGWYTEPYHDGGYDFTFGEL